MIIVDELKKGSDDLREEVIDNDLCTGCMACEVACKFSAVTASANKEGFYRPIIDGNRCVKCGICASICPVLNNVSFNTVLDTYAAQCKNQDKLIEATSGGVFEVLADEVLSQGGVVIGAVYDEDIRVVHDAARNTDGIRKMNGSKYVQSYPANGYRIAINQLAQGINVLFSGTPCQVSGLLQLVGDPDEHLVTVDVPCYGVPSPAMFADNIKMYREKYNGSVTDFRFRDKHKNGFSHTSVITVNSNGIIHSHTIDDYRRIPYHYAFGKRNCFQSCCYDCRYTQTNRVSDITVASFWDIRNISSDYDYKKGVSMVLCNSKKGRQLFEAAKDKCIITKQTVEQAQKANPALVGAEKRLPERDRIFNDYIQFGYSYICRKYYKFNAVDNLLTTLKRILRKMYAKAKKIAR